MDTESRDYVFTKNREEYEETRKNVIKPFPKELVKKEIHS